MTKVNLETLKAIHALHDQRMDTNAIAKKLHIAESLVYGVVHRYANQKYELKLQQKQEE